MRQPNTNEEISIFIGIVIFISGIIIATIAFSFSPILDIVLLYRSLGIIFIIVGFIWNIAVLLNNDYDLSFLFEKEEK